MTTAAAPMQVQSCAFLLELSADWLILRASENVHRFLGEYHVTLVGRPLADFTLAQPLHDLRNSLSRQISSTGIARAYRVRLTEGQRYFDMAFQVRDGRILLEGAASPDDGLGARLGSVSRMVEGLGGMSRAELMDSAARRLRALTGYDRAIVELDADGNRERFESSRSPLPAALIEGTIGGGTIIADTQAAPVPVSPREMEGSASSHALMRLPSEAVLKKLRDSGVRSLLAGPLIRDGQPIGRYQCDSRTASEPSFELHAAADLFAQIIAMQLGATRN